MIRYEVLADGAHLKIVEFHNLRDTCEFVATLARDLLIAGRGCVLRVDEDSRLPMLISHNGQTVCVPKLDLDEWPDMTTSRPRATH